MMSTARIRLTFPLSSSQMKRVPVYICSCTEVCAEQCLSLNGNFRGQQYIGASRENVEEFITKVETILVNTINKTTSAEFKEDQHLAKSTKLPKIGISSHFGFNNIVFVAISRKFWDLLYAHLVKFSKNGEVQKIMLDED